MKKVLVVVSVFVVALVIFGAGFFFAQSNAARAAGLPVGFGPGRMMMGGRGGQGQIHEYVEQALADKLGMTVADVETALSSGKSMSQIAIDKGTKAADVTALLSEVHKTALAKAVTDGLLTQAQADTMLQNMTANGFNYANCPMQNGGGAGRGGRGGRGGWGPGNTTLAPGASAGAGNSNQQPTATP
jgi:hypothetical protein